MILVWHVTTKNPATPVMKDTKTLCLILTMSVQVLQVINYLFVTTPELHNSFLLATFNVASVAFLAICYN